MATYGFANVNGTFVGPTGFVLLGQGSNSSKEGITITQSNDRDVMTIGADGTVMHSLREDKSGQVTVRLMETSPANALLLAMYEAQALSTKIWGNNMITLRNAANNEIAVCSSVAFTKRPDITYTEEGQMREWVFNAGTVDVLSGVY